MLSPSYRSAITQGKGYRILRQSVSDTLERFNITMPEWTLLALVDEHKTMRQNAIALALGIDAPLVTVLIRQLEDKKLITVEADPSDNRAKNITVTKEGINLLPSIETSVQINLEPLMQGIAISDVKAYFRLLEMVIINSEQL